jgi:hypothetical protein
LYGHVDVGQRQVFLAVVSFWQLACPVLEKPYNLIHNVIETEEGTHKQQSRGRLEKTRKNFMKLRVAWTTSANNDDAADRPAPSSRENRANLGG